MNSMMRVAVGFLWLMTVSAAAENWTDFRGPTQQGVLTGSSLPVTWSESENVAWKTDLPGAGWSTPVIWENQIWMTAANETGSERYALCVDRTTGKLLKQITVFTPAEVDGTHRLNSHASPSPAIEAGRVYVHFGTYGTACIDTRSFEILWTRTDLNLRHSVGPGSSPILHDGKLIVHCDGTDVQYIVALDAKTGKTVWKTPRSRNLSDLGVEYRKASSTPIIVSRNGRPAILSIGAHRLSLYDPADGREVWWFDYYGYSNVARPLYDGQTVYFSTGYDDPSLMAITLGKEGLDAERWKYARNVPAMPSPLLADGLIFMTDDSGIATCVDASTGEVVWRQRIGGEYSASPVLHDGKVYFFSQAGVTTVIEAGREFKEVARNQLDNGFMASPVAVDGAWYLRTKTHLYRIESANR